MGIHVYIYSMNVSIAHVLERMCTRRREREGDLEGGDRRERERGRSRGIFHFPHMPISGLRDRLKHRTILHLHISRIK